MGCPGARAARLSYRASAPPGSQGPAVAPPSSTAKEEPKRELFETRRRLPHVYTANRASCRGTKDWFPGQTSYICRPARIASHGPDRLGPILRPSKTR
ncbi:hypothetical protein HPB50_018241 [Hyalomma asiaticum]|uniref:Uncharacterized protein n=1 Tax=Hyalomma asiaticum TaxID=266040 RepID=A0ACB7SPG5_HYAAI|nr:hypothetical protein HPB50_018241 [Hyalomma asiaticum]